MENTIKIFDPKEKPYGSLSNNATSFFELGGEKYKTVTHYVYSNMLHFPTYKTFVRNQLKVREIYPLFMNLYRQELHDITVSAVNEANEVKFGEKELKNLLLASEGHELIYLSNDPILGVRIEGENVIGENALGRSLMRLREKFSTEIKKEQPTEAQKLEDKIYTIYKAYQTLEAWSKTDNMDVSRFEGASYKEIIASKSLKFPDKSLIIQLYNRGTFPIITKEIENPGNLFSLYLKNHIDEINLRIKYIRQNKIFSMYLNYMLEKNYSDIPKDKYEQVKKESLTELTSEQLSNLRERVTFLFEKGMLSGSLSDRIDESLANLPKPFTKEEMKRIKSFEPVRASEEFKGGERPEIIGGVRRVFILEDLDSNPPEIRPFSPHYFKNMEIFALEFPTVTHYIITKLLSILRQFNNLGNAHRLMMVEGQMGTQYLSIPDYYSRYNFEKDLEYVDGLEVFTVKGMDKKFSKNFSLQDLLLSTGNAKILYTDRDPILGTGTREEKGSNFVGKYLQELRKDVEMERSKLGERIVDIKNVSYILLEDIQLRQWLESRISELCQTVGIIQDYFQSKYEFEAGLEVSTNFVLLVIDNFYVDCYQLYRLFSDKIKTEEGRDIKAPSEFIALLANCKGFDLYERRGKGFTIDPYKEELIQTIWNYFASLFYSLIKVAPRPTQVQIRKVLASSQMGLSKERECLVRLQNKKMNCILSAMMNILAHLRDFTLNYGIENFQITDSDIIVSMQILLNRIPKLPVVLPDSGVNQVELGIVTADLKKIDGSTNEVTAKYLLDIVKFIAELRGISKSTKQNRVNFFSESI